MHIGWNRSFAANQYLNLIEMQIIVSKYVCVPENGLLLWQMYSCVKYVLLVELLVGHFV